MGLLARFGRGTGKGPKTKKSYVSEFLDLVVAPYLDLILQKGVKIVTNAGGLDPVGLKEAIEEHLKSRGHGNTLKVAAVYGDDILPRRDELQKQGAFEGFDALSGAGSKEADIEQSGRLLSLNAYLGAAPITEALKQGADIVVTGRCVDSALVAGPLAFELGWQYATDQVSLDRLASASLAGHIIECGAQATGGNFTDWKLSALSNYGGWSNMGYPILTFGVDNTFSISKPAQTGGVVTCNSVCEQMLYEVLDPENYALPDVVLDMSQVRLDQVAPEVVRVRGAKGKPPTPWLKCTAVEQRGSRIFVDILVRGEEAESKAKTLGKAIIDRTNDLSRDRYAGRYSPIGASDCEIILIGNDASGLGPSARRQEAKELVLRVAARHENREVLDIFSKEAVSFLTNSCPGICLLASGRPKSAPNFIASSILLRRDQVFPMVQTGDLAPNQASILTTGAKAIEAAATRTQAAGAGPPKLFDTASTVVGLHEVAVGRSGDKGDTANIAIIARNPSYYPYILQQVTAEVIFSQFSHLIAPGGTVTRFGVPGVSAVNFVLTRCLGGGGLSSLRLDRSVKATLTLELTPGTFWT